jgi:endonuclease YncB( thermonuclease family)
MRPRLPTLLLGALLSLVVIASTHAARRADRPPGESHEGAARVVDGDTISVGSVTIRLHGIDAPESAQTCAAANGGSWSCGAEATRALTRLIGRRPVACAPTGNDKYGRMLAVCRAGETDLGAEMVRTGHAWAFVRYSRDYMGQEEQARSQRLGIWQAPTQTAWDYRAERWQWAAAEAPEGCSIKGNVSWRGERIYHMPWSRWYGAIRMDLEALERKGKRWFCSENDAITAGWRPAWER